jgi:glyoxylate/hydroxypyruvate reductase A
MSVLIAIMGRDNTQLITQLQGLLPNELIEQWPDCRDLNTIEFVLAWNAPSSLWSQLPNLKTVSSFGAGVDSIDLSQLSSHVEVVRIVDDNLANDMAEYVLTHVFAHKLRIKEYFVKQAANLWQPKRAFRYNNVALLGFGELAKACANKLLINGFKVSAWAKSKKAESSISLYYGQQGLDTMLANADYVVCLLPLTRDTKGIINSELLAKLPAHAVLINVARGQHVIDHDLLLALNSETLRAATLDVFADEPLAQTHPFWQHLKITLTPHCAALSDLTTVVNQIAHNIKCTKNNLPLKNCVDRTKGY